MTTPFITTLIKRRGSGAFLQKLTTDRPVRVIPTLLREEAMTFNNREAAETFLNTDVPPPLRAFYKLQRAHPKGTYSCCGAKVGTSHLDACPMLPKS